MSTVVIGGGIAGVTASRMLAMVGNVGRVALFDRGQRLGGRLSSRPMNDCFQWHYGHQGIGYVEQGAQIPPGTQILEGQERVEALTLLGRSIDRGSRLVAIKPPTNELLALPDSVDVHTKCNVVDLQRTMDQRWRIIFEQGAGTSQATFDTVIVADFSAARSLLGKHGGELVDRLRGVDYRPTFAYIARISDELGSSSMSIAHPSFAMLRRAEAKPYVWGFTSQEMTKRLLDEHPMMDAHGAVVPQTGAYRRAVANTLDVAVKEAMEGCTIAESFCHRWGRAFPMNPINDASFFYDDDLRLGVCGDMFRVDEAAPFESARRSAEELSTALSSTSSSTRSAKL